MLKAFIKRTILEADEHVYDAVDAINALLEDIRNKFPKELIHIIGGSATSSIISINKNKTFWDFYESDRDYVYQSGIETRDKLPKDYLMIFNAIAFHDFIKGYLLNHEIIINWQHNNYSIDKEVLRRILNIADNYEEFYILVKRSMKQILT